MMRANQPLTTYRCVNAWLRCAAVARCIAEGCF
jgi:hypothetical protein